jgi:hypothetical protein
VAGPLHHLGHAAQPLFDLPAQLRLVAVHCQTAEPVDDVNAVASDEGISFVQAKRSANLSEGETSALGSAIDQFVRQQKRMSDRLSTLAGARSLDPQRDRLVLATRSGSSAKITEVLPRLLRGLRDRSDVHTLYEVQTSQQEREVAKVLDDHVVRRWKAGNGRDPTAAEMRALLRLIWVHELDVEDGGRDCTAVLDLMRANLLVDSSQAGTAFSELVTLCARLRADRSGADIQKLLQVLIAPAFGFRPFWTIGRTSVPCETGRPDDSNGPLALRAFWKTCRHQSLSGACGNRFATRRSRFVDGCGRSRSRQERPDLPTRCLLGRERP